MTKPLKSFFYLLALATLPCSAQWSDSFSDADFRNHKNWTGDTSEFEINSAMQLHLSAPSVSGSSCLVTESDISTEAEWKFWLQMDFNPSASNYAKLYLISDKAKVDSAVNGYYLKIGGTNDDISLFRQDGVTSTVLIDGRDGMLAAPLNKLSIKIKRNSVGEWIVSCDSTGQSVFKDIGQRRDTTYYDSKYFGIQCIYTATRSTHFLFDDFSITGKRFEDTIPPFIKEIKAIDDSTIRIEFSEPVDEVSLADVSHYSLSPGFGITNLKTADKAAEIRLTAPIPCSTKLNISVSKIADNYANSMRDTSLQITYCSGGMNDVIISEIMADPDPQISLPNQEYLELYNSGESVINLEQWNLFIGNDQIKFPYLIIPPDSFLVITTREGCKLFEKKSCIDILPGNLLNNTGEYICLKNKKGKLINWVNYNETFYRDELKKNGGWSLEMIDLNSPCVGSENWKASSDDLGGTPGTPNSHKESVADNKEFQYNHIHLPSDSSLRVYFSKPLDVENISANTFNINPDNKAPEKILADSLQQLYVDLIFRETFQPNILYELQISPEITDCAGEILNNAATVSFGKPSPVVPKDIIINEILFDALPGSPEFVEIYNNSGKYINGNEVRFAYKTSSNAYESLNPISDYPFLIAPQSFLVLVKNSENIELSYSIPEKRLVLSTPNFPTLSNEEGCFALLTKNLEILDEFCYSEKMHFPLIVNKTGVSLERTDYNKPTLDAGNWHSASSTEGYSTPGKVNSQHLEKNNMDTEKEITLEYEIFSPDNDGHKDYQTISYKFELSGYVANIIVFDALGRKIKILANNQLLGTSGSFTWDGINQDGQLASTGIYLIYIRIHHPSGDVKEYKKTCVLGGELKR